MPETTSQTLERDALEWTELATAPVDILNDEAYRLPFDEPVKETKLSPEQHAELGIQNLLQALDGWLLMKVKDELTLQLYEGKLDEASIDALSVARVIEKEAAAEQARHTEDARRIAEVLIPEARLRTAPDYTNENLFWHTDLDNLHSYEMMYTEMADFIASMPQSGEDWSIDLAQKYIARAKEAAYKEAAKSLQA